MSGTFSAGGLITGLDTNIAQPLDVWLQRIDGEPALQRRLVRPLRDEVERYGHFSLAAESMYDHPFQWLSLIHILSCRRSTLCRSRWSPSH